MKISTKGTSRFLSQEDIPAPFIAIIQDVRTENLKSNRGDENKYILYFTTGKPMVFNVVNRKTVVAAYGPDSDTWIGRAVEVFVDPNVWMGSEQTGGIRLRVPANQPPNSPQGTHRQVAATTQPAALPSAPAPVVAPNAQVKTQPPAERSPFDTLLAGYDAAKDRVTLDQWAKWSTQFSFTEEQWAAIDRRYEESLDRIGAAMAAGGRRIVAPA